MATQLVTIKVTPKTRLMLRVLALYAERDMFEIAEALVAREIAKKHLQTLKGTNHAKRTSHPT